jgi:hypothetical protein
VINSRTGGPPTASSADAEGALLTVLLTSDWASEKLPWLRRALGDVDRMKLRESTSGLISAVLVGGHLGNYF